jgi:tetratricopeptide (TPR) repeat protein
MLTAEYLYNEFGRETIVAMLALYRDGKPTREVIQTACGIPQPELERRVKAAIIARARGLHVPPMFILDDAQRFKARLETSPDDAELHARYAQALAQRFARARGPAASKLADEAREHADKAIELGTTMPEPHTVLAFLELRAGNAAKASRHCHDALARDRENFTANAYLGDIAAKAERFEEAVKHYTAAKRTYPRQARIGYKLAKIHEDRGHINLAIAELEHIARVERHPYAALTTLGRLYADKKDWKNVVRVLERALDFNLYDPQLYSRLGRAYAEREDDELAAARRAIGADVAYLAATSTHKKPDVKKYLRLALEMVPDHEKARELAEQIGGLEDDEPEPDDAPEPDETPEPDEKQPAEETDAGADT